MHVVPLVYRYIRPPWGWGCEDCHLLPGLRFVDTGIDEQGALDANERFREGRPMEECDRSRVGELHGVRGISASSTWGEVEGGDGV